METTQASWVNELVSAIHGGGFQGMGVPAGRRASRRYFSLLAFVNALRHTQKPLARWICSIDILLLSAESSFLLFRGGTTCGSSGKDFCEDDTTIVGSIQRGRPDRQHTLVASVDNASPAEKIRCLPVKHSEPVVP